LNFDAGVTPVNRRPAGGVREVEVEKSTSCCASHRSGKTLLARTLAKILDVPFAISDATTLTEAGYLGEDVKTWFSPPASANYDSRRPSAASFTSTKSQDPPHPKMSPLRATFPRGRAAGVLKILEGTVCNVPPQGGRKHPNQEYIQVNTSNILFTAAAPRWPTRGAFILLGFQSRRQSIHCRGDAAQPSDRRPEAPPQMKKDVRGVDWMYSWVRVLASALGRNVAHGALENLQ